MHFRSPVRTFRTWLGRRSPTQSAPRRAGTRQVLWVESLESRELWSVGFAPPEYTTQSMAAPVYQAIVSASPPFADNFNRADSATLGSDWTAVAGGFGITGQLAIGKAATNIATVNTLTADNVAVEVYVGVSAGQSIGLVARYGGGNSPSNFYLGYLSNTGNGVVASIYRNVGGSYTQISSQAVGTTSGPLRFELSGTSLKLFLNNALVGSGNDSTFASGKVGLYSTANVAVDNFAVTSITPVAQTLPFSDSFDTAVSGQLNSTAWTNQAGVFTLQTGVAFGNGSIGLATLNGLSAANVAVSLSVAVTTPGQFAGLVARYSGPGDSNYYLATLYNTGSGVVAAIYRNLGGAYTQLAAVYAPVSSGLLVFEASGTSLKLFLNGKLLTSANDAALKTGSVGMRAAAGGVVDSFNATVGSAYPQSLPFTDAFATSTMSQLDSNAWTNQAGLFNVAVDVATGPGALSLATVNGVSAANVALEANVALTTPGQFAGLVARYGGTGDANYYLATLFNNGGTIQASIYRNLNGAYTQLAAANTLSNLNTGLLRFEVSGSSLMLYFNGILLASANDAALTTGSVGMRSTGGGVFSDFNATTINVTPQTLPFSDDFSTATTTRLNNIAWTNQAGAFTLGGSFALGTGALSLATVNGVSAANVAVEAFVSLGIAGQFGGLVARYGGSGDSNYYLATLFNNGGTIQAHIFRNLNGAYAQLAAVYVPANAAGGLLRFEASGTSLKLFLNGTLLTSANDTALTTGSVGMRSSGSALFDNFNATTIPVAPQALGFLDTFTVATSAQLGNIAWTNQAGVFTVANSFATGPAAGTSLATLNGLSAANVIIESTVAVAATGRSAGLVARYGGVGERNFYLAELYDDGNIVQARIFRNLNGAYTLLATGVAPTDTGLLRFEVSGTSLKLFLNGTQLASATDSALTTGSVGMRATNGGAFDNFSVN